MTDCSGIGYVWGSTTVNVGILCAVFRCQNKTTPAFPSTVYTKDSISFQAPHFQVGSQDKLDLDAASINGQMTFTKKWYVLPGSNMV